MRKISVVFGTRPEAIKLAPVIVGLREYSNVQYHVCVTAQHRGMLDQMLDVFDIQPDADLNIMRPSQTLAGLTARSILGLDSYMAEVRPDLVLVQGDTTTTFAASLTAFYHHIPVGHVEAGLRTGNLESPWPEEANRILTTRLAALHFAPTELNRQNLLAEGVSPEKIFVTGNTVIDALFLALKRVKSKPIAIPGLNPAIIDGGQGAPVVLITGHRRESFGEGLEAICQALAELARRFPHVHFVYPVHLNPNVRNPVARILGNSADNYEKPGNIHLIDPLPYLAFVALMDRSTLILTDSGGIQEEAPSLGKPVLVMRNTTERPEAITAGTVKLVGAEYENIVRETSLLLTDRSAYWAMVRKHNPYGDGKATPRILRVLLDYFENLNASLVREKHEA